MRVMDLCSNGSCCNNSCFSCGSGRSSASSNRISNIGWPFCDRRMPLKSSWTIRTSMIEPLLKFHLTKKNSEGRHETKRLVIGSEKFLPERCPINVAVSKGF